VNAALQSWLPFLGATVDPSDADQLCIEQHHLEFCFLGAFVASDVDVRRVENGAAFVRNKQLITKRLPILPTSLRAILCFHPHEVAHAD